LRRGENGAERIATLVRRVEFENAADGSDDEAVFVCEIKAVETVDELRAIGHGDF